MSSVIKDMEMHLDNVDAIKEAIKTDIENLFKKLNVKSVVNSPGNTVDALKFAIIERMTKKYIKPILKESQEYVSNVLSDSSKEKL